MRNALLALIVLIVASCSTLPKMWPENPECRTVFQIQPLGDNWHDIRSIEDEGMVNTKMFPDWYDKGKALLDGSNTAYFNPHSQSFIGIVYRCFDFPYTQDSKKADMIFWEKSCLGEQYDCLNVSYCDYKFSMPQDLVPNRDYESALSFSSFERINTVPTPTTRNLRLEFFRFTIFCGNNHSNGMFLQLTLLTEGSEEAMNDYKQIVSSLSFPQI